MSERYTDPCYGVKMTHVFPDNQSTAATGGLMGNTFRMPFKAKLLKIGVIVSPATEITCSSGAGFHLRFSESAGGTELAAFVPGTLAPILGTGKATGCAPETATRIKKGRVVESGIKTVGFDATSHVTHFMDYQRVFDGGA